MGIQTVCTSRLVGTCQVLNLMVNFEAVQVKIGRDKIKNAKGIPLVQPPPIRDILHVLPLHIVFTKKPSRGMAF